MAETRLDMANLQAAMGQPATAIRTLLDGLAQLRQTLGGHHPQAINMLRALCSLERATDTLEAASRDCHASLRLAQELHGANHRATVEAHRQLAALYVDLGRFREAETIFVDTTAWMGARLDKHHPDMARAYSSLAVVAWERGDIERAVRLQRQAVEAWRKSGNAELIAAGVFNLALILHHAGRDLEALPLVREATALHGRQYGAQHALVGDDARLLGEILDTLGQPQAAQAALEKAVRLTRAGFGPSHSHTRRAEISLARLQAQRGDAAALARLAALGQARSANLEQRKAAWLARAYAADVQCRDQPRTARRALDAVLADMRPTLPEGGAIPREVQRLRDGCGSGDTFTNR